MVDQTFVLATLTENDLANQRYINVPISSIKPGDVVVSGSGTLHWTYREVISTSMNYTYGALHIVHFADGTTLSDTSGGFWYTVIKTNPAAAKAASDFATAYATAWDNRK